MKHSPYRKEQFLPYLKTQRFGKRWLFVDTETHIPENSNGTGYMTFKLGYAIYIEFDKDANVKKRQDFTLTHKTELYNILHKLDRKKKKLYVVAHNWGFDLAVLDLPHLFKQDGIETEPPIKNGMTFLWRVDMPKGSLGFIDTGNYAPMSLEKIGQDIGFPKLSVDFNTVSYQDLMHYCKRDTEILLAFMQKLIKFLLENNLGSLRSTLASQALATYRTSFMPIQPFVSNFNPQLKLARKAYYGGRTEAYYIGVKSGDRLYYVDINSAYPFAMMDERIPTKLKMYRHNPSDFMLDYHLENSYVIADVELNTNIPFAPKRLTEDYINKQKQHNPQHSKALTALKDKLIFPIGTYRTTLHHDELIYARQRNLIDHVHTYACYEYAPIFRDYINFFYNLKKQAKQAGNQADYLMSKLFMNSLYGKFGQRYHQTEFIMDLNTLQSSRNMIYDEQGVLKYIELIWFGKMYRDITAGESTYSIPSIAGAITAKGRMLLWRYIETAGYDNVFYCDTDSLIVNFAGLVNLLDFMDDYKLGYLDLELQSRYMEIHNAKDYTFGAYEKTKGVPKNARQIAPDKWEYELFEGFKRWRNRGAVGAPTITLTTKQRRTPYNKGIVTPSGDVVPYTIVNDVLQFQHP